MFSYNNKRSIYLYNEHMFERRYTYTSLPRPFPPYSFSIILYLYKRNTLSRTYPFPPLSYLFLCLLFYYILYIQRGTYFPATFTTFPALSLPSIILLLYIEEGTLFPPLFLPSYKVNTFSTAPFLTFLIVWEKFAGKSF